MRGVDLIWGWSSFSASFPVCAVLLQRHECAARHQIYKIRRSYFLLKVFSCNRACSFRKIVWLTMQKPQSLNWIGWNYHPIKWQHFWPIIFQHVKQPLNSLLCKSSYFWPGPTREISQKDRTQFGVKAKICEVKAFYISMIVQHSQGIKTNNKSQCYSVLIT